MYNRYTHKILSLHCLHGSWPQFFIRVYTWVDSNRNFKRVLQCKTFWTSWAHNLFNNKHNSIHDTRAVDLWLRSRPTAIRKEKAELHDSRTAESILLQIRSPSRNSYLLWRHWLALFEGEQKSFSRSQLKKHFPTVLLSYLYRRCLWHLHSCNRTLRNLVALRFHVEGEKCCTRLTCEMTSSSSSFLRPLSHLWGAFFLLLY